MASLGMDQARPDEKSPLELFQTAYSALEEAAPLMTPLLAIRSSINQAINHLINERPSQERASNQEQKMLSIGKQLKRGTVTNEMIDRWAEQWKVLNGDLSSAKTSNIDREQSQSYVIEATHFLQSLLSGLDPNKLRSRQSR